LQRNHEGGEELLKEGKQLNPVTTLGRNRKWIIKPAGDKFQVGFWNRQGKAFNAVCCCDYYDQACLICETLKEGREARDYLTRGVE